MSKATLVDIVREQTECTVNAAKEAVDAIFETISKSLKKEGSFAIVGFGTFKVAERKARIGPVCCNTPTIVRDIVSPERREPGASTAREQAEPTLGPT